jgi:hypothetical protein
MLHGRNRIENLSVPLNDLGANARAQIKGGPQQSAAKDAEGQPNDEEGHPTRPLDRPIDLSRDSHVEINLSESHRSSEMFAVVCFIASKFKSQAERERPCKVVAGIAGVVGMPSLIFHFAKALQLFENAAFDLEG